MPRPLLDRWRDRLPPRARRLFRLPPTAAQLARDLDDEVRHHIEMRTADLRARGMSSEEADREALRQFGDARELREYCAAVDTRRARRLGFREWLESWAQDARFSVRQLKKTPGTTAIAILTLALALGATTTIVSVVEAIDLRSLPYRNSERIVVLNLRAPPHSAVCNACVQFTSFAAFDQEAASGVFAHLAAYRFGIRTFAAQEASKGFAVLWVTPDFFPTLGTAPLYGRALGPEDTRPGAPPVAVASYDFWTTMLHGDPAVVGRRLELVDENGAHPPQSVIFVGVMPPRFDYWRASIWLALDRSTVDRNARNLAIVGLLKANVSVQRARAATRLAISRASNEDPVLRGWSEQVVPMHDAEIRESHDDGRRFILLGLAVLVLVLASANVAALFLARLMARDTELATRMALGAGQWRLVRQLVLETVGVAVAGGALGLLVATWGVPLAGAKLGIDWTELRPEIDLPLVSFGIALSVFTGVLVGTIPALRVARLNLADRLRARRAGGSAAAARGVFRSLLIVAQVAGALVLSSAAGLLTKELRRLERQPLGFDSRALLIAYTPPEPKASALSWIQLADRTRNRVRADSEQLAAVPGVEEVVTAASASGRTFTRDHESVLLSREDIDVEIPVSDGYFRAMRQPVMSGRGFSPVDRAGAEPVGVINAIAARRIWPGQSPLGKHIVARDSAGNRESITIVGVAGDTRWTFGYVGTPLPALYRPIDQVHGGFLAFMVRVNGDPDVVLGALRRKIVQLYPGIGPFGRYSQSVERQINDALGPQQFDATALVAFASFALLLAAMGVFGIVSWSVGSQSHEIGIRMALGAGGADIVRIVSGAAFRLGVVGAMVGAALALAFGQVLRSMLAGTSPTDPIVLGGSVALLMAVLLIASYLPARRALRIDPATALRAD